MLLLLLLLLLLLPITTPASGVFGNDKAWITGAIKAATAKCERMMRVLRALKNCDSLILL